MSGKPKIDDFHYHVMLDRLHVMMSMANDHLQQHPVAKLETEVASHISIAVDHLWQAHQLIGNKT